MRPGPGAANGPSAAIVGVDRGEPYTGVSGQPWRVPYVMPASCGVWLLCWGVGRGAGGLVGPRFLSTTHREHPRDARWSKDVSKTEGINAPADPASHRKWRDDLHRQNRRSRSGDRSPPFWTSWPKFLSPGLDGSGARRTLRNCRSSHAQARRFRGARAGYHGAVPHYWPHYCCGVLFFRICRICRPDTASPSPPLCSGAFSDRCWRPGRPRRAHRMVAPSAPATGVWADRGASQPGAADYAWADTAS